jgi:iron complex outermembrane receptor protein
VPGGSNFNNRLLQNIGSLRNAGVEFGFNARVLEGRGSGVLGRLTYDANLNASTNRNRLLQISTTTGAVSEILNGQIGLGGDFVQTLRPGLPLNAFRVLRVRRDASGNPVTGPQTTRNTTYYVDQNGDNEITDADLVAYKSPQPRWILGHTSNLAYGNFDLNFTLRSYLGHYVYNRVAAEATFSQVQQGGVLRNLNSQVFRYNFLNPQFNSELLVERADFLRMDNITVGYSLPNYRGSARPAVRDRPERVHPERVQRRRPARRRHRPGHRRERRDRQQRLPAVPDLHARAERRLLTPRLDLP